MEASYLIMFMLIGLQGVSVVTATALGGRRDGRIERPLLAATLLLGLLPASFFLQKVWIYGPHSYLTPLVIIVALVVVHVIMFATRKRALKLRT
jgi:hypothetical protein